MAALPTDCTGTMTGDRQRPARVLRLRPSYSTFTIAEIQIRDSNLASITGRNLNTCTANKNHPHHPVHVVRKRTRCEKSVQ